MVSGESKKWEEEVRGGGTWPGGGIGKMGVEELQEELGVEVGRMEGGREEGS